MQYKAHRHNLSKPMQLSLCVLVLTLSLVSVLLGSQVLMASLNQYRANSFLADWEAKRYVPSEQAWDVAEQAIDNAIAWYPAVNGAYSEQYGYMWQWRGYAVDPTQANAKEYQQQAIAAFRQATQLRPTWPYAWSGLAYAKLIADELDIEFTQAMQQAANYGPSRIGINRRLAEIGLISWPKINKQLRELTLDQAGLTARYSLQSRAQLFALAANVQRVELLCQYLQDGIKPCAPLPDSATSSLNLNSPE